MGKPVRILQIIDSTDIRSGITNVILNWHRNIDRTKIQFDYLTFLPCISGIDCKEEIKKLGGKIFYLNYRGIFHSFEFIKKIYNFFKQHRYHIIHSHITHLNLFFYPLAKMFGTKNIIQHSHGTKWSDKKINGWRNYLMLHAVWPLITHKLACSELAGKIYYKNNFTVIYNGIDTEKFAYNPEIREIKRKELGVEKNFVIGHVGRFSREKNHIFLIDIFEQVIKKNKTARLVLVGDGPLKENIKNYVAKKKLQDEVIFLGIRKDMSELYQAFDCFVFPSLHEGMPVTALEAQASGLPCLFSNTITKEVLLLPQSKMLALSTSVEIWANTLLLTKCENRLYGQTTLKRAGFDSRDTTKKIQQIYEEYI